MLLVLGVDAATWRIVSPNMNRLPNFRRLAEIGQYQKLLVKEKLISASIWCGMFSGKTLKEHGHQAYVKDDKLVKREDIPVEFIWDILDKEGYNVGVLNCPFVVPPFSFNTDFNPVGFGLPTNEREWEEELRRVTEKTREILKNTPDLVISVYTLLDRVQHFHWGEETVLQWYQKVDREIGRILFDTGFFRNPDNKLILLSDHGFCSFGEARIQTLPEETPQGRLKGDHHEDALLLTARIDSSIRKPQDVFHVIREVFSRE